MLISQPLSLCFLRCGPKAAAVVATALLCACNPQPQAPAAPTTTAGSSPPPVAVSLATAQLRSVAPTIGATGQITSARIVEIKPQITGLISRIAIQEGDFVKEGQLLLELDARHEAAQVEKARAQLARDEAALDEARRQQIRAQELMNKNFISQGSFDAAQTQLITQQANVAAANAALKTDQVALSYTRIYAPASGRVGAIAVSRGSQVAPNLPAILTITQINPILVSFAIPQKHLPDALKALAQAQASNNAPSVKVRLPGNTKPYEARLQFVDSNIDTAGTVRLKALLDNEARTLWPGAFVHVELALSEATEAIVIPQAAIVQGIEQASVWVVGEDSKATMRKIQVIQTISTEAAVSGLQAGEQVVVDGRQNIKPGSKVAARTATKNNSAQRNGKSS
jgi:RND family efflux transporter MFP subunit